MANYFATKTAQFKPFSYQEMLAPIKAYQDAYNALETEMSNLDIMAGDVASKLTQNPKDAKLRETYNKFQTDMQSAMNELYNNGYNSTTRKQLAKLKARYTKELNPINEAYQAYQEDQKYLNKMTIEHPELIIKNKKVSISDYMHGNRPSLSGINTNELRDEALKIAEQQASRTYKEDPTWTPIAGGRALERSSYIGLKDEDFTKAMIEIQSGNITSDRAKLIKESIDSVLGSVDTTGLSDNEVKQVYNSVIEGIRAGFKYKKDTKTIDDPMFAHNLRIAEADYKQQLKDRANAIQNILPTEDINKGSITGGSGLANQNDFVKTLVTNSKGVTTATAIARESEKSQLEAELKNIIDTYGIPTEALGKAYKETASSKTRIGGAAGLAGIMNASTSSRRTFTKNGAKTDVNSTNDVAYNRYFEIQDRLSKIPEEIQSELNAINVLADKYGHLDDDLQTAIIKGNQLELNQASINGIYVKPIIDPTLDKKVKSNILDLATASPENSIKIVTNNGKIENASSKDLDLIKSSTADDFIILTNPGLDNPNIPNPIVLKHKESDREFVLTAASTLNNFANSYKKQTSFIRDYSKECIVNSTELPIDALSLAVNYGIMEGVSNQSVLPSAIKEAIKNTKQSFGNDRYGYTFKTQGSINTPANTYKIITEMTPYGEIIVGVSSLNNEAAISNGGVGSGTFARTESQRYINDLIKTLQK